MAADGQNVRCDAASLRVLLGSYPTFAELKIDGLRCGTVKLTELHFELEQGRTAHVQQDVLLVTDEVPGDFGNLAKKKKRAKGW